MRNREFWTYFVGIWLIHRNLWTECGGYDERFIYYNWMEVEMILRLRQRYSLIDFGKIVDCDFYHLDHRNPRVSRELLEVGRPSNTFDLDPSAPPLPYYPNSDGWGLAEHKLQVASGLQASPPREGWSDNVVFAALVAHTKMQLMLDRTYRTSSSMGEACRKGLGGAARRAPPRLAAGVIGALGEKGREMKQKGSALSLVLCLRNDECVDNSRCGWRAR